MQPPRRANIQQYRVIVKANSQEGGGGVGGADWLRYWGRGWKISCPEKGGDAGRKKKLKLNPKKARPGALPAALFNR